MTSGTIGILVDDLVGQLQSLPSAQLYALIVIVAIVFCYAQLGTGLNENVDSVAAKQMTDRSNAAAAAAINSSMKKTSNDDNSMPQPKWQIFHYVNCAVIGIFSWSVATFCWNATAYYDDSTLMVQFLIGWSIFLCYFFGFFGVGFIHDAIATRERPTRTTEYTAKSIAQGINPESNIFVTNSSCVIEELEMKVSSLTAEISKLVSKVKEKDREMESLRRIIQETKLVDSITDDSIHKTQIAKVTISSSVSSRDYLSPQRDARRDIPSVITGTSAGLPGGKKIFQDCNLQNLIEGYQCITQLSDKVKETMVEKNVVQLKKFKDGSVKRIPVDNEREAIKIAGQLGEIDLTESYGVPIGLAKTMDLAVQVAVAAGMEALKSAGLVSGKSNDPKEWMLPEQYRDSTGVIYASSFPALDAAVGELMKFLQSKTVAATDSAKLVSSLRSRLIRASPNRELSDDDEVAFARLLCRINESEDQIIQPEYQFDRKFLFRVLVLGNSQLAQLAGCRGPNTQTNAACAGTTQAIAMAHDMLSAGRAKRVVVVAGDNASGSTLIPWLGSGFRALGAASTESNIELAACPFDKRRAGMILGAGAVGIVLETETSAAERQMISPNLFKTRARLIHTQYSNSAYHGAALDRKHIASELIRFLKEVEINHGICKTDIATNGVYFSHETCTHASAASSCAGNEVAALRDAFGDELLSKLLILNTKGFTGHAMGVSFEDVVAVEALLQQRVPPVPNYIEEDAYLGKLNISRGGSYSCRYALRFAAGFGSHVVFALYATCDNE